MTFESTRFFPARPDVLFGAFADGRTLARWWGPAGFTNEFKIFDFREGGAWTFTMIGPDGVRYANECVFEKIDAPNRLVIAHVVSPRFRLTVNLTPDGDGTRLTWTQAFENPDFARSVRHLIEPANEQNLDRLNAVLGLSNPSPPR